MAILYNHTTREYPELYGIESLTSSELHPSLAIQPFREEIRRVQTTNSTTVSRQGPHRRIQISELACWNRIIVENRSAAWNLAIMAPSLHGLVHRHQPTREFTELVGNRALVQGQPRDRMSHHRWSGRRSCP